MLSHKGTNRCTPPAAGSVWWALSGATLLLATLYALAVVIFRLPAFSGDNRLLFRTALALHVELAVFAWLMSTMAAQWLEQSRRPSAWLPAAIAGAGIILLAISPLAGGTPQMLDYFPVLSGNRLFAIGLSLICGGIFCVALETLLSSRHREAYRLAAWASLMALLTAATTTLQDRAGVADIAWAAGHTLLFAHVIMLVDEWPRHARIEVPPAGIRWLASVATALPWIPLLVPPGSDLFRVLYSQSMAFLLWPPALWVMARLVGSQTFRPPFFDRLTLTLSMSFFVIGCGLGTLIDAPTTLITAHYHATMGAIALSRMGMSYRGLPLANDASPPHHSRQLATYACGLALLAAGLALASIEGAPRKTSAGELIHHGQLFTLGMSVSGLGGLLAMLGTGWWIYNLFVRPLRLSNLRQPVYSGRCHEP